MFGLVNDYKLLIGNFKVVFIEKWSFYTGISVKAGSTVFTLIYCFVAVPEGFHYYVKVVSSTAGKNKFMASKGDFHQCQL